MGLLTPEGAAALRRYVYRGKDLSYLYKYFGSPWADFCVRELTPTWVAPNLITLIGLILQASSVALIAYYTPDLASEVPWFAAAYGAFTIFAYSTLDNMDGKQARRTGSSSPLGLLFDHGCDAVNAAMTWIVLAAIMHAKAGSWLAHAAFLTPTIPFFMNTWEEFHIGELVLPIINGPNEGLLILITMLLGTAYYGSSGFWQPGVASPMPLAPWILAPVLDTMRAIGGAGSSSVLPAASAAGEPVYGVVLRYLQAWWAAAPAPTAQSLSWGSTAAQLQQLGGTPGSNAELFIAGGTVLAVVTILSQTINVVRFVRRHAGSWADVGNALARQLPLWALMGISGWWLLLPPTQKLVEGHWIMFYGALGCQFVDMTCTLMVVHVADQHRYLRALGFLPHRLALFAAAPAAVALGLDAKVPNLLPLLLLLNCAVNVVATVGFAVMAVNEVAAALDIDVFDISKQIARSAKGQPGTSTLEAASRTVASPVAVAEALEHYEATGDIDEADVQSAIESQRGSVRKGRALQPVAAASSSASTAISSAASVASVRKRKGSISAAAAEAEAALVASSGARASAIKAAAASAKRPTAASKIALSPSPSPSGAGSGRLSVPRELLGLTLSDNFLADGPVDGVRRAARGRTASTGRR